MNNKRFLVTLMVGVSLMLVSLAFGGQAVAKSTSTDWMSAMHDSPAMERMHEQMSSSAQTGCDRMHAQMQQSGGQVPGGMMQGSNDMMGSAAG